MTKLAVIIPSVGRPSSLRRTLQSVARAQAGIEECIVVARTDDGATQAVANEFDALLVLVEKPGLAWAMKAGAMSSKCDVVAFTDDDAEIPTDWAPRILAHYVDPKVGAVGGRDIVHGEVGQRRCPPQRHIGTIDAVGRVVGGHHLATGKARIVDHIKGVNSSFRRAVFVDLDFQELLHGRGAQSRNEFVASRGIAARGFKLIFDPSIAVDHFPGDRAAGDDRGKAIAKIYESSYNEQLGFRLFSRKRAVRNLFFSLCVGYGHAPGIVRLLRKAGVAEIRATWRGIRDARRAVRWTAEAKQVDAPE